MFTRSNKGSKRDKNVTIVKTTTSSEDKRLELKNLLNIFDKLVEAAVKSGIEIYHKRGNSEVEFTEHEKKIFLTLLFRIQEEKYWKLKNVIGSNQQLKCILQKQNISKEERKNTIAFLEKWHEHMLLSFPAPTKKQACVDISNHYKNYMHIAGVKYEALLEKISKVTASPNILLFSSSNEESQNAEHITSLQSTTTRNNASRCRLCGEDTNDLAISIYKKNRDVTYKELIEYFCRVEIIYDERLPQLVCSICKITLDNFSKFSEKVLSFQDELCKKFSTPTTVIVKTEPECDESDLTLLGAFFGTGSSESPAIDQINLQSESSSRKNSNVDEGISMNDADVDSLQKSAPVCNIPTPILLTTSDTNTYLKPCSVKLIRLPIQFNKEPHPYDDMSYDEDINFNDFIPMTSSPVTVAPKFHVLYKAELSSEPMAIDETPNSSVLHSHKTNDIS